MKTLLVLSLLIGGSGTVVANETTLDESIYEKVLAYRQGRRIRRIDFGIDAIQANGFPMPSDTYLDTLTADQKEALVSYIQDLNVNNDFTSMSDEEVKEVLQEVMPEFRDLLMAYNIKGFRESIFKEYIVQELKDNGFTLPNWTFLDDLTADQTLVLNTYMAEINATYDLPNMSDEAILDAFDSVKIELRDIMDDLGIIPHPIIDAVLEHTLVDGQFTLPGTLLEQLDGDAQLVVTAFINDVNAQYDFDSMTKEEQINALKAISLDFKDLLADQNIDWPTSRIQRIRQRVKTYKHTNQ